MKLEHLIQAFNFNRIPVTIDKEIINEKEKAGVIKFNDDIYASYLLDDENIVVALNLFINGIMAMARGSSKNTLTLSKQIEHTKKSILVIQKSIELLGNTKQEEANKILKELGAFSGKIEEKAVEFLNYVYKIDAADGILIFSIVEKVREIPPSKISSVKTP